jgi:hypothetical protein
MSTVTIVTPLDHAVLVDGTPMPDDYDPFATFANDLADRIEREAGVVGAEIGIVASCLPREAPKGDGRAGA